MHCTILKDGAGGEDGFGFRELYQQNHRIYLCFTAHVVTAATKHMTIVTTHKEMTRTVKFMPGFDIPWGFGSGRIFEA